jgi:hypothetical protein
MTKISTIDPVGYILAPLAAPATYVITVSFLSVIKFWFDGTFLTGLFWQITMFLFLMTLSSAISMPVLWALRNVARHFLLAKSWFIASVIVLAFLFLWLLTAYLSAASVALFVATILCGLALNFLIFARFYTIS